MKYFKDPKIIIFEEKHGNRTFYSSCLEDACKIFKKILKERFKTAYYEWLKESRVFPETEELTQELIDQIPNELETLKKESLERFKRQEENKKRSLRNNILYQEIEKECLSSTIDTTAYLLLEELREGSYEGWEVETPEDF